jgi:hypothetical protein
MATIVATVVEKRDGKLFCRYGRHHNFEPVFLRVDAAYDSPDVGDRIAVIWTSDCTRLIYVGTA